MISRHPDFIGVLEIRIWWSGGGARFWGYKMPISAYTVHFWTQVYQIFLFYFLKRIPNIYTDFWYLDKKIRSKFHGPVPSHKIWPPIFLILLQRQTLKGYKIKTDCENGWIYIRFKIQIWLKKIKKNTVVLPSRFH